MARPKTRRQSPVKGGRDPLPACVLREIWAEVDETARRFGVSRSWVIATVLGDYFGVRAQADYRTAPRRLRKAG